MSQNVQLPALGESVTEGTVTRWLKNVGDRVEVDEPLLEISTDKVDTEIPSPFAGVVEQILVPEDETAQVGAVLAVIGDGAESAPAPSGDAGQGATQAPAEEPAAEQPTAQEPPQQSAEQHEESAPARTPEPASAPTADEAPSTDGPGQEVRLPALGESVTEGTVTRWLKQVGDPVEVDEPLLEISTDKVDTEVPSPFAGTVQRILVQEDETAQVGAVLAVIGSSAGAPAAAPAGPEAAQAPAAAPVAGAPEPAAPASASAPSAAPAASAPVPSAAPAQAPAPVPAAPAPAVSAPAVEQTASGAYLTPLVRKLAAEKGVDTAALRGTGVGGRIRKEDVLEAAARAEAERAEAARRAAEQAAAPAAAPAAAAAAPAPAAAATVPAISPLRGTTEKASRLRQIIAERMVEALHTQAQLTTVVEVDVTKVARLRARAKDSFKAREGVNLTFLPFFVLAAVEALKAYPKVNGVLEGNQITYHGSENVGIAVDTERGLVVPVIRDAGDLNLAGVARKIADLAGRTRANKVGPDELSGATFTVTNTGSGGAVIDTPIVPGGTSAILGTGAIVKRPVVVAGEDGTDVIAIRSMCYLCLSYDHRLVDGADASRYLMAIKRRIEEGAFEAEVGL
ncbi:MAG: 2-oxoglutarate dehydrogenase, E2 component, dihydrolipoamide succinyltransferase [Cellulomonas sp. 14-74-6]|nr:MAG: 2-oxoglutarate dehydrogenase, E2 component, dihydrolipoamide succinyltransferase [Cellulomonas sp. 14-74-6]